MSGLIRIDEVTDFSRRDFTCSGVTWEKVNIGYKGLVCKSKILCSSLEEQAGWEEDIVMKWLLSSEGLKKEQALLYYHGV